MLDYGSFTIAQYRLLDEELPSLYVSNTLHEPRVTFHKSIPKVGAYYAALLKSDAGRAVAVLAADSLNPPGNASRSALLPFALAFRNVKPQPLFHFAKLRGREVTVLRGHSPGYS